MKIIKLLLPLFGAFSAFVFMFTFVSFAATEITSVSISLIEEKSDPGVIYPVEVSTYSKTFEIEDISVSKDYSDWSPGKKVTYTIVLIPKDSYKFSKSNTNFYVANGDIASKSVTTSKATLKVNYTPKVTLEAPENIYYEDEYLAVWDKVTYAKSYTVRIYKNGTLSKTVTVTKTEIDLSTYATDDEDEITFSIAAGASSGTESKYLKISSFVDFDSGITASDKNTTSGSFIGNFPYAMFRDQEGGYVTGWQQINSSWYYFKPENNYGACSEWLITEEKRYYFNSFGIMQTGWIEINNTWYYFSPDGSMVTGWLQTRPSGPWYYMDLNSGAMLSGTITPDGYYIDDSGKWIQ